MLSFCVLLILFHTSVVYQSVPCPMCTFTPAALSNSKISCHPSQSVAVLFGCPCSGAVGGVVAGVLASMAAMFFLQHRRRSARSTFTMRATREGLRAGTGSKDSDHDSTEKSETSDLLVPGSAHLAGTTTTSVSTLPVTRKSSPLLLWQCRLPGRTANTRTALSGPRPRRHRPLSQR